MLTTVTANPCVDLTLFVRDFKKGATNRPVFSVHEAAGKGVNVARAYRALGGESFCTGFDFSEGETSLLERALAAESMPHEFVPVSGKLRTCVKIFDETNAEMTEVNESGGEVSPRDEAALLSLIASAAEKSEFLSLSGSLPRGVSPDFYARAIAAARAAAPRCRIAVDAAGETLGAALAAAPDLIKPNESEFCALFGIPAEPGEIVKAASALTESGKAGAVCVSMGERGAYLAFRDAAYFCPAPRVTVRSLQAAGDAMLAGLIFAATRGEAPEKWLLFGTAMAGATVSRPGSEIGRREEAKALFAGLSVEKIR